MINIKNQNGNLVVSSREVAENFSKEHNDTKKRIRELIKDMGEKSHNYFITVNYLDSMNREQEEHLMTRDGFSLLVMGFTGSKALEWKLKYIEAFNKMEESIRNQALPQNLSPQLQLLINMELKQRDLEISIMETKEELQSMRNAIIINPKAEWRKKTNEVLNAIGKALDDYSRARNEVYEALKDRAGCRPNILINNLKKRALENGMSPSKADKLNILDVLENDTRLREIYISIVKEMSIKYKIA